MSVNLYKLDRIKDFDLAIAALEEFVEELVVEFVAAKEGRAYLEAFPAMTQYVGSWIDHLLYFGYAYESVTLPNMSVSNVEVIVGQIFPNKISLLDPAEADTVIPELTAFWQWLEREYQHPQASEIVEFLEQLQPNFTEIMNDPYNFGIAKSFLMSGITAKFEGEDADLEGITSLIGDLTIAGSSLLSPIEQVELENSLQELASEVLLAFPSEVPSAKEFQQQLQGNTIPKLTSKTPDSSISAILKQQQISATTPGTLLQDFQTLLNLIGDKEIEIGESNLLPMELLVQLNQRLSEPLKVDLQYPQQKAYPNINGLYLLLTATGIGVVRETRLTLNSTARQWLAMNPVEQYLNLFEAWLTIANKNLGESSDLDKGFEYLQYWLRIPSEGHTFEGDRSCEDLEYYPGLHNLTLMKLFGLIEADYDNSGMEYQVKSVRQTAWGKALMQAVFGTKRDFSIWEQETAEIEFGSLQPRLQVYFPQWQKTIDQTPVRFKPGTYVFKVSWHQIWRRIAISSKMTLWDLSQLILRSIDFNSDCLDLFCYQDRLGKTVRVVHPYMDEYPSTTEVEVGCLPLEIGSVMEYLFDGDSWEFQIELEEIAAEIDPNFNKIIASYGEAPPQYPNWGEDWEAI